jgi:hypothetical protein
MTHYDLAQKVAQLAAQHAAQLHTTATQADQLTSDAQALADLLRPTIPPVLTGPPWPIESKILGRAKPDFIGTGTINFGPLTTGVVKLGPTTGDPASSDMHEVHCPLTTPLTRWRLAVDIHLNAPALRAKTWKWGGMVAFDGDWKRWPGGNTSAAAGPSNAMVRITGDHWARDGHPRFGVYATFPKAVAPPVDATRQIAGAPAWVSNKGHTCHWLMPDTIIPNWYRVELTVGPTSLTASVNGVEQLTLNPLPWPPAGFNRLYVSTMLGGSSPDFLPDTPDRTGTISYRRAELHTQ